MENFFPVLKNIILIFLLQFSFDTDIPDGAYLCQKFMSEPHPQKPLGHAGHSAA